MNILLTGSNGNLGTHLQKDKSHTYLLLNRQNEEQLKEVVNLNEIDIIIHAASDIRTKVDEAPSKVMQSNVLCTTRLLEKLEDKNIKRFFYISSCAVYGDVEHTISEEQPLTPICVNGATKLLNEKLIYIFCKKHNIPFTILRLFNLYGGNDNFSVFKYLKSAISEGKTFNLNNEGVSKRDFIHVEDVSRIIHKLLIKDTLPNIINIGSGVSVSIKEILEVLNKEINITTSSHFEIQNSQADNSLLKSIVDVEFRNVLDEVSKLTF